MRALVGEDILQAWERSRDLPEHEAALALLAVSMPGRARSELAALPLGERNALLLEVRAASLGRRMEGFAVCPQCGAQLEFSLDARGLAQELRAQIAATQARELVAATIRPVNSLDLIASSEAQNEEQARSILLSRTVQLNDGSAAQSALVATLSPQLETPLESFAAPEQAVLEQFERINAAAEIRVQFECAACRSQPLLDLDVARFVLREIAGAARRLMVEIHELASAYGWTERSIATMSSARRAAYLEMLSA